MMKKPISLHLASIHRTPTARVLLPAGLLLAAACGEPPEAPSIGSTVHAIQLVNGLSNNGLSQNGLSNNALSANGLSSAALSGSASFASWFNTADGGNAALHDEIMTYVVRCALKPTQSTSFTDQSGTVHSWPGGLGLAPGWLAAPPAPDDVRWVSACMMGLTNAADRPLQVSVRGTPWSLDSSTEERRALPRREGVFFGDLSASPAQIYVCAEPGITNDSSTTNPLNTILADWGRQCAVTGCGVMHVLSNCDALCAPSPPAAAGSYPYSTCTVGGVTYPAISIYLAQWNKPTGAAWALSSGAAVGTCSSCTNGQKLAGMGSAGAQATLATTWVKAAGSYVLSVRYANPSTLDTYLTLKVNGQVVLNGTSDRWSFAPTGGADLWGVRSIPVSLPAEYTTSLVSPGSGLAAPEIDALWLNFK